MLVTTPKKMTLEEFLNYDDGTDTLSELAQGELVCMPYEDDLNRRIATFLLIYFAQQGVPFYCLSMKTEVVVISTYVGVRVPDLLIFSEELATALAKAKRSVITMDMPAPSLAIEVVSAGQEKRDYRYKRSEYAARGIPEYWIIDPSVQRVTLLQWIEGMYEEEVYIEEKPIVSPLLGNLSLTAAQIFQSCTG